MFLLNLISAIYTFARRFHATRGVHGVAEETVTGHFAADDTGHDGPGVGPASYLQSFTGTFGHLEYGRSRQQVQRHRGDLGYMLVT